MTTHSHYPLAASILLLLILPVTVVRGVPAKPVLEIIELLTKRGGGKTISKGAVEAIEAAYRIHCEKALRLTQRTGSALADAASKHGDQVPRRAIQRILELPPDNAHQLLAYASHTADPAVARALLEAVEKKGGSVFTKLDASPIRAYGLSAAMVTAASGVPIIAVRSPESITTAAETIGSTFVEKLATLARVPIHVVSIVGGILLLIAGTTLLARYGLLPTSLLRHRNK